MRNLFRLLGTTWRAIALSWHLGRTLLHVLVLGIIGLVVGAVVFATPPVLMLLDEFAALGRLEPALQAAGLMAGLSLQLWPILQDLTQLRAAYGQNAGTFLANAGLIQASAPADLETAQWLSRSLGNATVAYQASNASRSTPSILAGAGADTSTSQGVSTQLAARPLLAPDEAMRLPPHVQVLLRPGHTPALVAKLRHFADPEFTGLAD